MDFQSLYPSCYRPTSPEEAVFLACTRGKETEISRVANEKNVAEYRVICLREIAKSGYDKAWPLYAVALSHLLKTSTDLEVSNVLSRLQTMEAVQAVAENASTIENLWADGKAPIGYYSQVMQAVQAVKSALELSKSDLVNIAKKEKRVPYLAVHLQLVPELFDSKISPSQLEGRYAHFAILKLNRLLKDHPEYLLAPAPKAEAPARRSKSTDDLPEPPAPIPTTRSRSSSVPQLFLGTFSRAKSRATSTATSPETARKRESFFETVSKSKSPRLLEASAQEAAEELHHYTLSLFQSCVRDLSSTQNRESLSPLTALANELSYFASLYVIQGQTTKERRARYNGITQIITASIEKRNFHVALSLYQGLQRTELTRLNEFPPCKAHEELFSPRGRWKNLNEAMGSEPHLPPIALFLGHLQPFIDGKNEVAIRECIAAFVKSHKELIGSAPSQSSPSHFMQLVKAISGDCSQEELEEKLQDLSSRLKIYPSVVSYFSDGDL